MILLMLWPPLPAQAQTPKTASFKYNYTTDKGTKEIAITATTGETLTINFSSTHTAGSSSRQPYFTVPKNSKLSLSLGSKKRIKTVKFKGSPFYNSTPSVLNTDFIAVESMTSNTVSTFYDQKEITGTKTATACQIGASSTYGSSQALIMKIGGNLIDVTKLFFIEFEVTYFVDDGTLPKENEVTYGIDYATPIEYTKVENPTEADWTMAKGFAPIAIDGAKVLVRLGKTVTTFTAPTPAKPATVIIDPAKGLIGATAGTSFFTKLTTSDDDQFYKVAYLYNYKTSTFATGYQTVAANLTLPAGATGATSPNIVSSKQDRDNFITADNATYTVKTSGLKDIFTGTENATLADGNEMCVAFDGIRVSYVSKDAAEIPPLAPVVTIPGDAKPAGDHKYKTLGDFDVTVGKNTKETYTDIAFKYRFSDGEFEDVPAGGKIAITGDCVLDVKAVSAEHGESGVVSYSFDKLENIVNLDNASALEGLEKGTLVRLNCPLQILASGQFKTNTNDFYILTHDPEYKSVPLVVRGSTAVPSVAYQPGASDGQGNSNQDIDHQNFLPSGGILGTLEFENGRPVIVLKDSQKGIDNFSLCYNGTALKYDGTYDGKTVAPSGKNYVRFTYTHNRRSDITAEDFGSAINIDATYNASTGKFTVTNTGADGQTGAPKELDVRQLSDAGGFTTAVTNTYSTVGDPTADGEYTLCGLVGYDYNTKSYFLLPRFIGKVLPELTIEPVNDNNATFTKYVRPDGDNAGELYLEMTGTQFELKLGGSNSASQYYCVEADKPGGSSVTDKYILTNKGEQTMEVKGATIPADEPFKLLVYLNGEGATSAIDPNTKMIYSVRMYHLNVYNAVEGADVYTSIAQLLQDAKEHPEKMNPYVRLTCPNMAIAAVKDNRSANESDWNCLIVKDVTPLVNGEEDADIPSLPLVFKDGIGKFSSSFFQYSNTVEEYYKYPRPGEYIQEMGSVSLSVSEASSLKPVDLR